MSPATDMGAATADADLVVLLVDHDVFDLDAIAAGERPVLDCRRVLSDGPLVERL